MSSSHFGRDSSHFSRGGNWDRRQNRKRSWNFSRGTDFHSSGSEYRSPRDEKVVVEVVKRTSIHEADDNLQERYRHQFELSRSCQDQAPSPPPRRRETPRWNESAVKSVLQPRRRNVHFAGQENVACHRGAAGYQSADPVPPAGILKRNEGISNYNSSGRAVFPPVLIADPIKGASKLEKKITNAMSRELSECISELKLSGDYDRIRKESMQKIEANPLFSEIRKKIQKKTTEFLAKVKFSSSLDKAKIREELRNMLTGNPEFGHDMDQVVNQLNLYDVLQPVAEQEVRKYLNLPDEETETNVGAMASMDMEQEEKFGAKQVEQSITDDDENSLESLAKQKYLVCAARKLSDGPKWIVNAFKPVGGVFEAAEEPDKLIEDQVPEDKMENECVPEKNLPPDSALPVIELVSSDEEEEGLDGEEENESECDSPSSPPFETFDQISPPRVDSVPDYEGPEFGME